jgi:hypothetical protein
MAEAIVDLGASVSCVPEEDGTLKCDCSVWSYYRFVQVVGAVFAIAFTLGLPVRTYQLIQRNKPVGSRENPDKRHNETGQVRSFFYHICIKCFEPHLHDLLALT